MDTVGIGWRGELAPAILSHLDSIDVVEVILDDYLKAPLRELRALRTLASQVPTLYHGVSLGLASSRPIEQRRLDRLTRVLDYLAPELWSEHLAFVRAGDVEIGHLAAPPRTADTIEGALENFERIARHVGSPPALENIATLVDPPGSTLSEAAWVGNITRHSGCALLLDLHNLYANARNFGHEPLELLRAFPLERVRVVHLSGGHWINEPETWASRPGAQRLLDDHVHDVPEPVFELLGALARAVPQPLTVIIERDGNYPAFAVLRAQIDRARSVLDSARIQVADERASA
jgi:uncharacterized protein (UPF0276 family)